MAAPDRDRARRDALRVAAEFGRPCPDPTAALDEAARLLARWRTDDGIRAVLRPVFAAAVPHQRALIALGDIDAWLPDGRVALEHWEEAAAGPDAALAAEAAWKAARAHLRAGRPTTAAPLLRQAAAGGWTEDAHARRRAEKAAAAEAAARAEEDRLRRAHQRLNLDDEEGAEDVLRSLERPETRLGGAALGAWERHLRGELAFRRGDLEAAEDHFGAAGGAPGHRRRELRLAQLAILRGDAPEAFERTTGLTDPDDEVSDEAWPLLVLHADLIAAGMDHDEAPVCVCGCCCDAECQGRCGGD
ncbi:hypothetical protein [Actinomycetospora sp. CA-084318]|uniref:hypothetical protein n=1 Tax=Actinomycetospora sp. CA-084318 TaxID=3239892 RepID=UPI003D997AD1